MGGILLGYLASNIFISDVGGWRIMYGASLVPAILLGLGMVSNRIALYCSLSFTHSMKFVGQPVFVH